MHCHLVEIKRRGGPLGLEYFIKLVIFYLEATYQVCLQVKTL